jgi:hypothetical protein
VKLRYSEDAIRHIDAFHAYIAERNPIAQRAWSNAFELLPNGCFHFPRWLGPELFRTRGNGW